MAKQVYLDRRLARVQVLRWSLIAQAMDREARQENPRGLAEIVEEFQKIWLAGFEMHTKGYKRKPRFYPVERI